MTSLYKKVIKGILVNFYHPLGLYPEIPKHYSRDLAMMVRLLLQVSAQHRPVCSKQMKILA
jgi:hypothetical protein